MSTDPPPQPKATLYATLLDTARRGARWTDTAPASTANGKALSWTELQRKYRKHVGPSGEGTSSRQSPSCDDVSA